MIMEYIHCSLFNEELLSNVETKGQTLIFVPGSGVVVNMKHLNHEFPVSDF